MNPTVIGTAAPGWPASGAVRDDNRIYVASRNLDRTRLIEVDARDLTIVRQRVLPGGDGAWALAVGPDGVYVGLFGANGRPNLFRVDGAGTTGVAALAADYIWELAVEGGVVYGVATGPALVFAYDSVTRRARDLALAAADDRPRTITVRDGRLTIGGSRQGKATLIQRDVDGGATTDVYSVLSQPAVDMIRSVAVNPREAAEARAAASTSSTERPSSAGPATRSGTI